jgi:selenocysteine-specific elongation factor
LLLEGVNSTGDDGGLVQFTLVDCPGHASLIRTIIGGAQIIDLMLLVVDVTKGLQTQTAECLVIGEITCNKMIVVLNKIDLIDVNKRAATIDRMTKRMLKTLEATPFNSCPIIAVAAKPGGATETTSDCESSIGISELIDTLTSCCYWPNRDSHGSFVFAVDHCFSIKGHGTVMTGTVVSGSVTVNDVIEIPSMKVTKKIKSMQMFKRPVESAMQGDRVGLCVTQFDAKQLERGLACKPGSLPCVDAAIISVKKIKYFKGSVLTKSKFHITIGHETVMGRVSFFGLYDGRHQDEHKRLDLRTGFDYSAEYRYQDELLTTGVKSDGDQERNDCLHQLPVAQFALVEFEHPVTCGHNFLVIGSKLDSDIHANTCRLAFHGSLLELITDQNYTQTFLPKLLVFKERTKEGIVERKVDDYTVVCRGLFKKETKVDVFVGLRVKLSSGDNGVIEGGFGQSGKFKVRITAGLSEETCQILAGKADKKTRATKSLVSATDSNAAPAATTETQTIKVLLTFKRYIFDPHKRMLQN